METRTLFNGAGWFGGPRTLDTLRRIIDEYNFAANLCLSPFDIYGVVGQLDLDYSVDQNIHDYIHSDSCKDRELKEAAWRNRKLRCDISVLALFRNAYDFDQFDVGDTCWGDADGNFWPSDQLQYDRGDRAFYTELAARRWKDEIEMCAEEANLKALSDVVGYCWQGGKKRHMICHYLWEFVPKSLVAEELRDQVPSEQALAVDQGIYLSEED